MCVCVYKGGESIVWTRSETENNIKTTAQSTQLCSYFQMDIVSLLNCGADLCLAHNMKIWKYALSAM